MVPFRLKILSDGQVLHYIRLLGFFFCKQFVEPARSLSTEHSQLSNNSRCAHSSAVQYILWGEPTRHSGAFGGSRRSMWPLVKHHIFSVLHASLTFPSTKHIQTGMYVLDTCRQAGLSEPNICKDLAVLRRNLYWCFLNDEVMNGGM